LPGQRAPRPLDVRGGDYKTDRYFAADLQTAMLLGIEVPETLLATADELIK
jgi:hypothetical protein